MLEYYRRWNIELTKLYGFRELHCGTLFQGFGLVLTTKFHVICNVVKLCDDVKLMILLRVLKEYKSDTFLASLNNINIDRKENKKFMICRNFPNES